MGTCLFLLFSSKYEWCRFRKLKNVWFVFKEWTFACSKIISEEDPLPTDLFWYIAEISQIINGCQICWFRRNHRSIPPNGRLPLTPPIHFQKISYVAEIGSLYPKSIMRCCSGISLKQKVEPSIKIKYIPMYLLPLFGINFLLLIMDDGTSP